MLGAIKQFTGNMPKAVMLKKILIRQTLSIMFTFCLVTTCAATSLALPPRPYPHRKQPPVVKRKVVVTPAKSTVVIASPWEPEIITEEKISEEEVKKRKIKPEYGLIDLEIFPYETKIYLDGSYKGYARTLNKDNKSIKTRKGKHVIELKKKNAPTKVIHIEIKPTLKTTIKQP